MKIRCYNIEYDLDEEDRGLPTEVVVSISKNDYDTGNVQVVDLITEATGYCVLNHQHEILKK